MSTSQRRPTSHKIILNVYDLIDGLGAYHSGVQIGDKEYAFGGHDYDYSGVFVTKPKCANGVVFRESIEMGETKLSHSDIEQIVRELSSIYLGNTYNLVTRNCNHFADEFCYRLLNKNIPGFVNRMAWFGSYLQCVLPANLGARTPNANNQLEASPTTTPTTQKTQFQAFGGSGNRLSESTDSTTNTSNSNDTQDETQNEANARRERLAAAATKRFNSSS